MPADEQVAQPQRERKVSSDFEHARQLQYFMDIFDLYDRDGDGTISAADLGNVLRTLGHDLSAEELEAERLGLAPTEQSSIDFRELMARHEVLLQLQATEREEREEQQERAVATRREEKSARKRGSKGRGGSHGQK